MEWHLVDDQVSEWKEYFVYSPTQDVKVFTASRSGPIHGGWHRTNGGGLAAHDSFYGDGDLGVTHYAEMPNPPVLP